MQGWGSSRYPYLASGIAKLRPSALHMAEQLRTLQLDAVVIAIDTWLGIWQHWSRPEWSPNWD